MIRLSAWSPVLLCLASAGFAHDDLVEQIARVTRQIDQDPGRALLYFRRGELHRLHEDWKAARADLDRAATLDPELAGVDLALGRVCNQSGDPRAARAALDRFLTRRPDHAEALIERARAKAALGERAGAVADYTGAIARLDEPWAENYLERAEVLRADGKLDEAILGIEEGVRRIGAALPLQLALIDLEVESGRLDAALARLDAVAAASERQELWAVRRGDLLRHAGRTAEARQSYRKALASIDALPPARRRTTFTKDLEKTARAALEATDEKR